MSNPTDTLLAYGYDLGGADGWKVEETDEYGELAVDWYSPDTEGGFREAAQDRLLASTGFTERWSPQAHGYFLRRDERLRSLGVELTPYGREQAPMYLLTAHVVRVPLGECADLGSDVPGRETAEWDDALLKALGTLGLTLPEQRPRWLLCASHGASAARSA
ncbi:hypothetical protein K7472_01240 [Streptomyces sp. PTM05]|uniref:Uncharacterized protein n=1 Tax=Streptantibioticus parmotrematis TaxID=2873249 RepID=A0ABS7QNT5_9ACTN|nr:hypothetical protein [Streptantibioticus parmotrematis]MBY8883469.1 hypothetical protein [Streptantibioticus parmotrematis]